MQPRTSCNRYCNPEPPCDPADPACNPEPPCDPADPACNPEPPCDPADPACNPEPPCDPADPACNPEPPCDPADPACNGGELDCGDGIDNDGDDQIDGEDPDCGSQPPCDPADPTCNPEPPCDPEDPACNGEGESHCADGVDNDGDGFPDETDPDCNTLEDCGNEVDDDGDGLADAEDPDCRGGPPPASVPDPPTTPGDDNSGGSDDGETPPPEEGNREKVMMRSEDNGDGAESPDILGASTSLLDIFTAEAEEDTGSEDEEGTSGTINENGNNTKDVVILIATGANRNNGSTESIYYSPDSLTLTEETKVTWINQDPTSPHTVTIKDKETGREIQNLILPYREDGEFVFSKGNFIYYDPSYPQLKGTVDFVN